MLWKASMNVSSTNFWKKTQSCTGFPKRDFLSSIGITRDVWTKIRYCQQSSECDDVFGIVEVYISVPEDIYNEFKEIAPIFCTTEVQSDHFGNHMQQHIQHHDHLSKKPRKLLVGGMSATKICLATPLLKWYLNHGLQVTKIYQLIEYTPQACFQSFMEDVSNARREGERDKKNKIVGDTMKLLGNSGYGSMIMDKSRHTDVVYAQGHGAAQLKINQPQFRKCVSIKDDFVEIELAKKKIKFDLPIQIGYFILQFAKLRMLQFHYDFLLQYCNINRIQHVEMDTDSFYLALSGSNLRDTMHEEQKALLHEQIFHQCHVEKYEADERTYCPRECCERHETYDQKTPGLFKLEAKGDTIVALCSKTYVLQKEDGTYKLSCKGLSKRALGNPLTIYKGVLESCTDASGINHGIRAHNNTMHTYAQERRAISYFYCKRRVLDDGINTGPLDIILTPWNLPPYDVIHVSHPLHPKHIKNVTVLGKYYNSLQSALKEINSPEANSINAIQVIMKERKPNYIPKGKLLFPGHDFFWSTRNIAQ